MDRKGHEKRIMSKTCLVASVASETNFSITLANASSGVGRKGVETAESMIGSRMQPAMLEDSYLVVPRINTTKEEEEVQGLERTSEFLPNNTLSS